MRYKILHIPTGEVFQVIGAHARSLEKFKKEFDIALWFVISDLPDREDPVNYLQKKLKRKLLNLGMHYWGKSNRVKIRRGQDFWVFGFTSFACTYAIQGDPDGSALDVPWSQISKAEFEILE